ncbi:hypothetical protein FOA52_006421 [Chlamydomonas sp. UWO 241]|nr:hypothetical protein FOA52_006421 [Chlamydomonas sp. UWO 241]
MAAPGAFTTAFNQPEHADVRLHLSTAAPGDEDERPAKKPRTWTGTATAPCESFHACSYYAHALVLSAQSAYFTARLGQDSSRFKPDDVGGAGGSGGASTSGRGSTSQICFEIVEHVDEADLEAMDMLLRTLYGAQVESVDAEVLLRALHLADRFLVSAPVAQLLASRLVQVPVDAITADIVQLAFSERSGTAALLPKEFLAACDSRHPAVVFRNVPAVVSSPDLLARFCSLSHAAVLVWAADGGLEVNSENDVVFLVSEWVEAQKRGGRPCSPEQLKQLVHRVRLSDGGPAYLQFVLPALDWFKSSHKSLGTFSVFQGLKDAGVECNAPSGTPDAWTAGPRERLAEREAVMEWHASAEQLEVQDDALARGIKLGAVFSNGFWMSASLHRRASKTTPGELTLGCFVAVYDAKMMKVEPWPKQAVVALSCSMELSKAIQRRSSVFFVEGLAGQRHSDVLRASSASVAALVAPHLEDGQLKGKVTFSNVGRLGCRA